MWLTTPSMEVLPSPLSSQKVQADSGEQPMLIIVWVITIAFFSCFFPIY